MGKNAAFEIFTVAGEHAVTIRQIFKDLIKNIKNIINPSAPQISYDAVSKLQALKDKILKYIEAKYPGLQAEVKNKIQEIFNKASNIRQLIANAISELVRASGDNADIIREIIRDLIKKVKDELKSNDVSKRSGRTLSIKQKANTNSSHNSSNHCIRWEKTK